MEGQRRLAKESSGSAQTFAALVRSARRRLGHRRRGQAARLLVGAGGCCRAVGAVAVAEMLRGEVRSGGLPIAVVEVGCTGTCYQDVQVTLQRQGQPDITWNRVEPDLAASLVAIAVGRRPAAILPRAFAWHSEPIDGIPGIPEVHFLAGQQRVLSEHLGRVDPSDVDEALARGAYRGLAQALAMSPEAIVEEVKRSRLAGRGGAYFPTVVKWEGCRSAGDPPRYLVVNAEEGEPGRSSVRPGSAHSHRSRG